MYSATVEEVQSHLPELLERVSAGEQVVITRDGKPVARLSPELPSGTTHLPPRKFGTLRGTVLSMERFDDPLEDFEEYM